MANDFKGTQEFITGTRNNFIIKIFDIKIGLNHLHFTYDGTPQKYSVCVDLKRILSLNA